MGEPLGTSDDSQDNLLKKGWLEEFVRRYPEIRRKSGKPFANNWSQWCTYDNFALMYREIYSKLVDAGIAEELEEEVMMDKDGNIIQDKNKMLGRMRRMDNAS